MKQLKLPKCPYCGHTISFVDVWLMKTEGEYTCSHCHNTADIVIRPQLYHIAVVTALISLCIFFPYLFLVKGNSASGVFLIPLPYLVFYWLSPYYLQLKRAAYRVMRHGAGVKEYKRSAPAPQKSPALASTTVMPALRGSEKAQPPRTRASYEQQRRRANSGANRPEHPAYSRAPGDGRNSQGKTSREIRKTPMEGAQQRTGDKRTPQKNEDIQSILNDFIDRYGE